MTSFIVLAIDGRFLSPVAIAAAGYCSYINNIHGPTGTLFQFYYNSMFSFIYLEFPFLVCSMNDLCIA